MQGTSESEPNPKLWKDRVKAVVALQALYRGHVARQQARELREAKVNSFNNQRVQQ